MGPKRSAKSFLKGKAMNSAHKTTMKKKIISRNVPKKTASNGIGKSSKPLNAKVTKPLMEPEELEEIQYAVICGFCKEGFMTIEPFTEHLGICTQNPAVSKTVNLKPAGRKRKTENDVVGKGQRNDDEFAVVVAKKEKNDDDNKSSNQNSSTLQSTVSTKFQSLFPSANEAQNSSSRGAGLSSSTVITLDPIDKKLGLSASNLRKNIATSLVKNAISTIHLRKTIASSLQSTTPPDKPEVYTLKKKPGRKPKMFAPRMQLPVQKPFEANGIGRNKYSNVVQKSLESLAKRSTRSSAGTASIPSSSSSTPVSAIVEKKRPGRPPKYGLGKLVIDESASVDVEERDRRSLENTKTSALAVSSRKTRTAKTSTGKDVSVQKVGRKSPVIKAVSKGNAVSSKAVEKSAKKGERSSDADSMETKREEAAVPDNPEIVLSGEPEILNPLQAVKEEESPKASTSDGEVAFTCAVCQKSFTRKYHLDRHLRISKCSGLPMPSYPCELCNRVYTRKDNLREHLRSHTGEVHRKKNHKCQFCDKAFHGQSLLAIHVRKHTGEKPFACDFCPKHFPSTGSLAKHRMTHTGERPYECNDCGRRFTLKGTLSRHVRTHTGIRPHTCQFCGKKFIQIGGLNAHMFYHTGENGFKCEDCGKVFNRKARLQMHQLYIHIKLKPFVCEHCQKPFTRKEDLMRHSVLHTGEKPFQCPTCDRRFSVKPSLKLHLLTHIKEEPRSCHECGRAFIRKDCLLRHMRKRHKDVFDKLLFDEKDEKDAGIIATRILSEKDLTENIRELLYLLIDEPTLVGFGWPDKPVDEVLESVIQRCGHTPVSRDMYTYMDRLRENAKLLFTVVIDDNAVKTLLNNQTVDEVILHVLRLAKT